MELDEKHRGVSKEVVNYIESVGNRISKAKYDLMEETGKLFGDWSRMLTNPSEGELLKMLVQISGAKKCLEVGTFTGYSALCIAEGLPQDGKLICLDISQEYTNLAKKHWKLNGVDEKIELFLGPGIDTLNTLTSNESNIGTFDFAYVDADKVNYINYYEPILKLLRPGGLIVFDNTLYNFKVADEKTTEEDPVALRKLNKFLNSDNRVDINMLNFSDGVTLVRKK